MWFEITLCVVFKAPFFDLLDKIRQPTNMRLGLPYNTKFVNKGWDTIIMAGD